MAAIESHTARVEKKVAAAKANRGFPSHAAADMAVVYCASAIKLAQRSCM